MAALASRILAGGPPWYRSASTTAGSRQPLLQVTRFSASRTCTHKRHDLALAAWAALPPPRPRLRLIGSRVAPKHGRAVRASIAAYRRMGTITVEAGVSRLG